MVVVVHVALMLGFGVLHDSIRLRLPLPTRVPLNHCPRVSSARFRTAEPAKRLPAGATHYKIAPPILLHRYAALRTWFAVRLQVYHMVNNRSVRTR